MTTTPAPVDTTIAPAIQSEYPDFCGSPREGALFRNPWPHAPLATLRDVLRWKSQPNTARRQGYKTPTIPVASGGLADFEALPAAPTRVFWIGHASFLLAMDGQRVVIDPIFGRAVITPRVTQPAATAQQLGHVDAVLVTHGHHDHLDPGSLAAIARVNEGRTLFVVPDGMRTVLPRECTRVVELSWWQHVQLGALKLHFVPAQHWHQRSAFDRNKRLWGGYVVEGTHRVYHSGDTGYFGGFGAIGKVFGGIDASCLPLGAYEPTWFMSVQHMSPPQSLQAYRDLHCTHFIGMHWGAFDLSNEEIDAGPRWLYQAVAEQGLPPEHFHVLVPGGSVALTGARGQTRSNTVHPYQPDGAARP